MTRDNASMNVEIWSDLVCPWCYLGMRRFEHAVQRFPHKADLTIAHRAYLLYPTSPRGTRFDRREMLMKKYRLTGEQADGMNRKMEATAAAEGLEYHLAGGVTGNTFDAHQVVAFARDRGIQPTVLERLYRAFFTERRSIFDRTSLTALAAEAGLDTPEVARVLESDAYAAVVEADLADARALGVNGVPFFVFDRLYAVSGAQPPEVLTDALSQAWEAAHDGARQPEPTEERR